MKFDGITFPFGTTRHEAKDGLIVYTRAASVSDGFIPIKYNYSVLLPDGTLLRGETTAQQYWQVVNLALKKAREQWKAPFTSE